MEQEAWDDLGATLMLRMHWAWGDLQVTPLSAVEAVIDALVRSPRANN